VAWVATIGVFDGVHIGHQALLSRLRALAGEEGAEAVVITFDPPPHAVLHPEAPPFQITPLPEKERLLYAAGAERVLVLPFTREFAALEPARFLDRVTEGEEPVRGFVVGADFRFGVGARGDVALLRQMGRERGFRVEEVSDIRLDGTRISSTLIRDHLRCGTVREAGRLLGRPVELEGRVVAGKGVGHRKLFPTANLDVNPDQLLPAAGVYAVAVVHPRGGCPGAANVGCAPTLGTGHERLIEVHLLDFDGELQGSRLRIRFREWLRPQERFADLTALRKAIEGDIARVRQTIKTGPDRHLASNDTV